MAFENSSRTSPAEGVIKFRCELSKGPSPSLAEVSAINDLRTRAFERGLIGVSSEGVGFGNISCRTRNGLFIISGSQSGHIHNLPPSGYVLVTGYSFEENFVRCSGETPASSESLTHAAVYEASGEIQAVVHAHSPAIWTKLLNRVPTTNPAIEYGTPEMAHEVSRCVKDNAGVGPQLIVMGGHREGLLFLAKTIGEIRELIEQTLQPGSAG